MLKEFKDFAVKGNLIDIGVGLVMGAAFATVTSSFVDGMFMPLIGEIFQVGHISKWCFELSPAGIGSDGKEIEANIFSYGKFIASVINFIIIAFVMFLVVKAANKLKEPALLSGPSQEELLTEIRDLLKK
ncbi:MAG: large conductance mechanosensitive channel protein MscL [Saprospiraceae bacterium]|nr:large conductance mechanosensitive channel protein MscL [Saprospiraceae bacterium]